MLSAMAEFQSHDEVSITRGVVPTLEWVGDGTQAENVKGHKVNNVRGHKVNNVRGHKGKNVKGHRVKKVQGHKVNQTYRHTIKPSDWLKMMGWDEEEKDEKKVRTRVSNFGAKIVARLSSRMTDSLTEIDEVEKKGGKIKYFVAMLTLGPNASNTQFKPWDSRKSKEGRRESKEDPKSRLNEKSDGTKVMKLSLKSNLSIQCDVSDAAGGR